MALTFVLDVSGAQPPSDWKQVKASGIAGVWAKATDGVGSPDVNFLSHAHGAKGAGMLVGAYHYLRVRSGEQDGAKQAVEFCQRYKDGRCDLPPMVDVESNGQPTVSADAWRASIQQFVSTTRDILGRYPIIYTSKGEWESFGLQSATEFASLPLWLANTSGTTTPPVPLPWKAPTMFQYSWKGNVPGISVNVDVSVFAGSTSKLEAWAGKIPFIGKLVIGVGAIMAYGVWKGRKWL